jgi:group I intron endonuclease
MRIIHHAKQVYLSPLSEKPHISLENRISSGVYALICRVTNKVYVGSSVHLGLRLLDYTQPAYLAQQTRRPILKAIVKYGLINFIFIVLETCNSTDTLQREQYWIDLLNPEYNLSPTAGSTLGITLSEETKAKIRAAHMGKTHSLETRRLMSETRRGPNNPMFGKSPLVLDCPKARASEETRALLSAFIALKGPEGPLSGIPRPAEVIHLMRVNHPHTKAVYQYTSDKVTFVAVYDSIRQAAELTGISRGYLTRCLNQGILAHGKWFFSLTPLV